MKPSLSVLFRFLLLYSLSRVAVATDWWFVPAGQIAMSDALVYVDKSSMRRTRGTGEVTAAVWLIYRSEQSSEFGSYRGDKRRMTLDCEKREAGADSGSLLSAFGGVIHRYKKAAPEMAPIQPDSPIAVMATFMCSDGKQPPRSLPVYDPSRDVEQRFLQSDRERSSKTAPSP